MRGVGSSSVNGLSSAPTLSMLPGRRAAYNTIGEVGCSTLCSYMTTMDWLNTTMLLIQDCPLFLAGICLLDQRSHDEPSSGCSDKHSRDFARMRGHGTLQRREKSERSRGMIEHPQGERAYTVWEPAQESRRGRQTLWPDMCLVSVIRKRLLLVQLH